MHCSIKNSIYWIHDLYSRALRNFFPKLIFHARMMLEMRQYSNNYTLLSVLTYFNEFTQCTGVVSFSLRNFLRNIWCTGERLLHPGNPMHMSHSMPGSIYCSVFCIYFLCNVCFIYCILVCKNFLMTAVARNSRLFKGKERDLWKNYFIIWSTARRNYNLNIISI